LGEGGCLQIRNTEQRNSNRETIGEDDWKEMEVGYAAAGTGDEFMNLHICKRKKKLMRHPSTVQSHPLPNPKLTHTHTHTHTDFFQFVLWVRIRFYIKHFSALVIRV
jgi:hypothetical protein